MTNVQIDRIFAVASGPFSVRRDAEKWRNDAWLVLRDDVVIARCANLEEADRIRCRLHARWAMTQEDTV
jgi:hypothetical protein